MQGESEQNVVFPLMERIKAPVGPATRRYFEENGEVASKLEGTEFQDVYISNPGQEKAVVHIDGVGVEYPKNFRKGSLARAIDGRDPDGLGLTLISSDWSNDYLLPELSAAQTIDLCLAQGIREMVVYANCYGGHAALVLTQMIKQREREGLPVPKLVGLIVLNSPVEGNDLRVPSVAQKFRNKLFQPEGIKKLMANYWRFSRGAKDLDPVLFRPFSQLDGENLSDIDLSVLSIVTTPSHTFFGRALPDVLVDTLSAREKLKGLFSAQKVQEVDLPGSHFVFSHGGSIKVGFGTHEVHPNYIEVLKNTVLSFVGSVLIGSGSNNK